MTTDAVHPDRVHIPSIDELLEMSNYDLVILLTRVKDSTLAIEGQLAKSKDDPDNIPDADWPRRARAALVRYQRGVSAINGVLRARNLHKAGLQSDRLADVFAVRCLIESAIAYMVEQNETTGAQLRKWIEWIQEPRDEIIEKLRREEAAQLAKKGGR